MHIYMYTYTLSAEMLGSTHFKKFNPMLKHQRFFFFEEMLLCQDKNFSAATSMYICVYASSHNP